MSRLIRIELGGNTAAARAYYADLVKICERADTPGRRELAEARGLLGR